MHEQNHNAPGHVHGSGNEKAIGIAALLTGSFMVGEIIGGILSGSLALIADAGHMLTDFAALTLAWIAFRLARRPASWKATYGFDRFSVLAALFNGLSLFLIAAWICFEAYKRLTKPVDVLGGFMFWVAIGGLVVNIVVFWVLSRGENDNLNIRAATLHVAGDLLGSVAAIVASLVIMYTGWMPIDPILSVFVAVIILRSAWSVVRESCHILLEGAPRNFDRRHVIDVIETELPEVIKVHHVHAWSITQERPMVTLEVDVSENADADQIKSMIKALLKKRFRMEHSTVEINRRKSQNS